MASFTGFADWVSYSAAAPLPAHKSPITLAITMSLPCFIKSSSSSSRLSDLRVRELLDQHHDRARSRSVASAGDGGRRLPGQDVIGRRERGIDPAAPRHGLRMRQRRQLEVQRLPVGIEDQVHEESFFAELGEQGKAVGLLAPVGLTQLHAMPGLGRPVDELVQAHAPALGPRISPEAAAVEQLYET